MAVTLIESLHIIGF